MEANLKHYSALAMASAATALIVPTSLPKALRATAGFGTPLVKADGADPQALFAQINQTLATMRTDIEANVGSRLDGLVTARVEEMNTHIGNLQTAMEAIQAAQNAGTGGGNVIGDMPGNPEYVTNFRAHMRNGSADMVGTPVHNAMQIGVAEDGGYLAPIEWDRSITEGLVQSSPIRQFADNITISGPGFSRLFAVGQPGSGWVGETAPRPQTGTPQFVPLTFGIGEIYANPAITQQALDDAAINLETWLGGAVRDEFSRQENIAFLAGNGVNKPHGILTYVEGGANENRHPLGSIARTDTAGAAPVSDDFLDLIYSTPAERIQNARWFINRLTVGALRKLKDQNGQYIWQPGMAAGQPASLHAYPITEVPGMPVADTAGNVIALFGDMRATYLVIDRVGIRVLRDPYTNKPYVMFYTTKRVGGGVQNPEYMRALARRAA